MKQLINSLKFNIALTGGARKALLSIIFTSALIGTMLSMFGSGIILHTKMLWFELGKLSLDATPAIGRELFALSFLMMMSVVVPISIADYLLNLITRTIITPISIAYQICNPTKVTVSKKNSAK